MGRDNAEKNKLKKHTLSRPTSWAGDHRYLLKRVPPTTISVATGFSTLLAPTLTGSPTGSIFFAIPTFIAASGLAIAFSPPPRRQLRQEYLHNNGLNAKDIVSAVVE